MKIGVRLAAGAPLPDLVAIARRAEAAGLSHIWLPDSPLNFREVWTTLGALAVSTERIGLSASVTNFVTRHVSVTASAARTLAEVAGDRFVLGIGSGDSAIGYSGLRASRLPELRAGVEELRRYLSGEEIEPGVRLRHATPLPIFLAAGGPKTLQLAGATADGVITSLTRFDERRRTVEAAAVAAGRGGQVEYVVLAPSLVTDDIDRDAMQFSHLAVRVAQIEGTAMFEQAGVRISPPDHQHGASGDVGHPNSVAEGMASAAQFLSPEAAAWYVRHCTVSGTPQDMVAALTRLRDLGADRVTLTPPAGTPEGLIETLADVIPAFAAAKSMAPA
jgi:5,10-methylenetetrahydromethanopterin reductase